MTYDLDTFRTLGEALAIGLLVGIERYRGRKPGEQSTAGVRTFTIVCLLGALSGLTANTAITLATFAAVVGLILLGYYRSSGESVGLTTEFAALLIFWIGYFLNDQEVPALALGIVLTIILASKESLHRLVKEQISVAEFESTLKFLAVVLVVYPILPDQELGPLGLINPRQVWGFVILVSTISYLGYFLIRFLGPQRGLMVGGLVGGLVSTTAVTLSLAERSRRVPEASRLMGTVAVLANAVQGPRLLFLIWAVDETLAGFLAVPLISMGIVGVSGAWLLGRRAVGQTDIEFPLENPYSVKPAVKFGIFFVAIFGLIKVARLWLGDQGTLLASAIAGAGSTSAVALSVSELLEQGAVAPLVAAGSVVLAVATNALSKWVLALVNGTRQMAFWLGGGLLTMVAAAFLALAPRLIESLGGAS